MVEVVVGVWLFGLWVFWGCQWARFLQKLVGIALRMATDAIHAAQLVWMAEERLGYI